MTKKQRTYLFILFILAFFIITPLVALYAAGYKFTLSWPMKFDQVLQKTGMFILDSEPRGARIYLNDKVQKQYLSNIFRQDDFITTPAKIKNLLPGEYNVKIEIDGYWSWEKKLSIKPGQSTYAEDVFLFKKNTPFQVSNLNNLTNSLLTNKDFAIYTDKESFTLINLSDNSVQKISLPAVLFSSTTDEISWSDDNKKILIGSNLVNLNDINNPINLNTSIGDKISKLKWGQNSDVLFYISSNSILNFNLNTLSSEAFLKDIDILDYIIKNNNLITIEKFNQKTLLRNYSLEDRKITNEIELPYSEKYTFINKDNKFLNIYDSTYGIFYLIDDGLASNPIKDVINPAKFISWINNEKLLYASDFEIWIYDFSNNQKTLLTRIGRPITGIAWFKSNNHMLFTTNDSINILEFDDRQKRNITQISNFDNISSPVFNIDGDSLYFLGNIGKQQGVFKLFLQ